MATSVALAPSGEYNGHIKYLNAAGFMKNIVIFIVGLVLMVGSYLIGAQQGSGRPGESHEMTKPLPFLLSAGGKANLSCTALMSSHIAEGFADTEGRVVGSLSEGTDQIAIEIVNDELMTFMTAASVKAGVASGDEFRILRNDDDTLMAIWTAGLVAGTVSSFTLNKDSGLAVWSKTRPSMIVTDNPTAEAIYMNCL